MSDEKETVPANPSETVPGGRYISGEHVIDAEGKVLEGFSVKNGEIVEGKKADKAEEKAK